MVLLLALSGADADPVPAPVPKMARHTWQARVEAELDALEVLADTASARGAWGRLHGLYRGCPDCCESSAAESFGWVPAMLFAKHWTLLDEFAALAARDPEWLDYVLRSLHGPFEPQVLRRAATNSKSCPSRHRRLCERIGRNAGQAAREVESESEDGHPPKKG